jgi:hypothetical protein
MYAEIKTDSKEEMQRFLVEHSDNEYANFSVWRTEGGYVADVTTDIEPMPDDKDLAAEAAIAS